MKLGRKKNAAGERAHSRGHGLFFYQLPSVLVSTLVILALAFLARYLIVDATQSQASIAMERAARLLASEVATEMRMRQHLLRLLASRPEVVSVLKSGDSTARRLQAEKLLPLVPDAIQLRLIPRDWDQPDDSGKAPLGYAGIRLAGKVQASGHAMPAEVHQLVSGRPYVALAYPVMDEDGPLGALLAAFPADLFQRLLDDFGSQPGVLILEQVADGNKRIQLAASGTLPEDAALQSLPVPGAIWEVRYAVKTQSLMARELLEFLGLCGLGLLGLMLVQHLQSSWLGRHLREDLEGLVEVLQAKFEGRMIPDDSPHLRVTNELLDQIVAGHSAEPVAPPSAVASQQAVAPEPTPAPAGSDMAAEQAPAVVLDDWEIPTDVFRAYDIRGLADGEITPDFALLLGQAFGAEMAEQHGEQVVVGYDCRHSSQDLARSLAEGLVMAGAQVIEVGQVPTPVVSFAAHVLQADGAVMVTASHNPPEYNGFKLTLKGLPVADEALQMLRERMLSGTFAIGSGDRRFKDVGEEYLTHIQDDIQLARPMKVVVDGGNGVAGPLAVELLELLGCEVVPLYCEPDGDFPNRLPDPSHPTNLTVLSQRVVEEGADVGLAFDGDGDRLGLVDNTGQYHWPDKLLMLLASDVLIRHPGADVLYDVKCSRYLPSYILSLGGRPQMVQSGHSRMRLKMQETGAEIGGEFSGHIFIRDRWYGFDDALYCAARILEVLADEPRPVAEVFGELPSGVATPEISLPLENVEQARRLMAEIEANAHFEGAELVRLDGLRVEYPDGWGLVRASNTSAALSLRFEADSEEALAGIQQRFREQLSPILGDLELPF